MEGGLALVVILQEGCARRSVPHVRRGARQAKESACISREVAGLFFRKDCFGYIAKLALWGVRQRKDSTRLVSGGHDTPGRHVRALD